MPYQVIHPFVYELDPALGICRIKQEDILQSAEASRDSLQARVRDQEVCLEQSLDALDANLQVDIGLSAQEFRLQQQLQWLSEGVFTTCAIKVTTVLLRHSLISTLPFKLARNALYAGAQALQMDV